MKKIKFISIVLVFCLIIGGASLGLIFSEKQEISRWERRKLADFPKITVTSLTDGSFSKSFSTFLADHFPLRNELRRLKAQVHFGLYNQKDNDGIYIFNGSAGKLDPQINQGSVEHFISKMENLYNTFVKDSESKAYLCIVPDKNYFLAPGGGYPHLDYDELYRQLTQGLSFMKSIDIRDLLSAEDYYNTDSHWRQECITDVADKIRLEMGVKPLGELEKKTVGDFYGVYYGQSALPLEPDSLCYLTDEEIELCSVYNHETKKTTGVYDMEKYTGLDSYDIFLSGAVPIIEIDNPSAKQEKELVIFRDSFGSSLAPLLISSYSRIILIDTRYIPPEMINQFTSFSNADVLFVYSTMMANSSLTIK